MWSAIKRFCLNEDGATAIEYALIGGIISIAIVGGATATGVGLGGTFDDVGNSF